MEILNVFCEREAKLFEAGAYPDRDIAITEETLDEIIKNTSEAPLRIEHMPTVFDGVLGVVKSLYRRGGELFWAHSFFKAGFRAHPKKRRAGAFGCAFKGFEANRGGEPCFEASRGDGCRIRRGVRFF